MLELFETIRLDINGGDSRVKPGPHLNRLEKSAVELGFDFDKDKTAQDLIRYIEQNPQKPGLYKLKISLVQGSKPLYSLEPYTRFQDPNYIIKLKLLSPSRYHCLSDNPLTRHKTTLRGDFADELEDCDEVIWLNERGEIAEGSYTNIFWLDQDDQWHTPALDVGILAGTMRAQIVSSQGHREPQSGKAIPILPLMDCFASLAMTNIKEGHYKAGSLKNAKKIIITNAMLGTRKASLYHQA
jgi:branched-subunit amino acid aminotransferase/4-amino-4-deoxychorismate lyase